MGSQHAKLKKGSSENVDKSVSSRHSKGLPYNQLDLSNIHLEFNHTYEFIDFNFLMLQKLKLLLCLQTSSFFNRKRHVYYRKKIKVC